MRKLLIYSGIAALVVVIILAVVFWPKSCDGTVTCSNDDECGGTINAQQFCKAGNVYANVQSNTCTNKGTCQSKCETSYKEVLIDTCDEGCANGECN